MWLKCSLCSKNCFFPLLPAIFFELPITRTFFDFVWRFELSGVNCTEHTKLLWTLCSTLRLVGTRERTTSYCRDRDMQMGFDGLLYIYNLNFYHFLKFTEGKPEVITNWLFSKQRTHQLTILWLACVARYAFLPLPGTYDRPHYYPRPMRFGSRGLRKFLRPRQTRRSESFGLSFSFISLN